jgi:hypothetical protein
MDLGSANVAIAPNPASGPAAYEEYCSIPEPVPGRWHPLQQLPQKLMRARTPAIIAGSASRSVGTTY